MPPEWTSAARGPADGYVLGLRTTPAWTSVVSRWMDSTSGQPAGTDHRTCVPRGCTGTTSTVPSRPVARAGGG